MQSGITASAELHTAFNAFVSSSSQRGLIVAIRGEQLVPLTPIPSSGSNFLSDLSNLDGHVKDNEAAYILLRRWEDRSDGYVAVTFVPDTAPVRSKMLFASTRLTLVRELGTERFKETPFMTTREELTKQGWEKHERHEEIGAPLTEEEQTLKGVREAEAEASMGTMHRSSHVSSHTTLQVGEEAIEALKKLRTGGDNLVQLKIAIATETIELAETSTTEVEGLTGIISDTDPRYSFFRFAYNQEGFEQAPIIFIYTCPAGSKIKERMVYATSRAGVVAMAIHEAGLEVVKKYEASSPSEITPAMIRNEFQPKQEQEKKQAFSRPKRPGKR